MNRNGLLPLTHSGRTCVSPLSSWSGIKTVNGNNFSIYFRPQNCKTDKVNRRKRRYSMKRNNLQSLKSGKKGSHQKQQISNGANELSSNRVSRHNLRTSSTVSVFSLSSKRKLRSQKSEELSHCDQSLLIESDPKLKQFCTVTLERINFPNFPTVMKAKQRKAQLNRKTEVERQRCNKSLSNNNRYQIDSLTCDASYTSHEQHKKSSSCKIINKNNLSLFTPRLLRSCKQDAELQSKSVQLHSKSNCVQSSVSKSPCKKADAHNSSKRRISLRTNDVCRKIPQERNMSDCDKKQKKYLRDKNNLSSFSSSLLKSPNRITQLHSKSDVGVQGKVSKSAKPHRQEMSFHVFEKDLISPCKVNQAHNSNKRRISLRLSNICKNIPQKKEIKDDGRVLEINDISSKSSQSTKLLKKSKKCNSESIEQKYQEDANLQKENEEKKENILFKIFSPKGKLELKIIPGKLKKRNLFKLRERKITSPISSPKRSRNVSVKIDENSNSIRKLRGETSKTHSLRNITKSLFKSQNDISLEQGDSSLQAIRHISKTDQSSKVDVVQNVSKKISKLQNSSCDSNLTEINPEKNSVNSTNPENLSHSSPESIHDDENQRNFNKRESLIEKHLCYLTDESQQENSINMVKSPSWRCCLHIRTAERTILKEIKPEVMGDTIETPTVKRKKKKPASSSKCDFMISNKKVKNSKLKKSQSMICKKKSVPKIKVRNRSKSELTKRKQTVLRKKIKKKNTSQDTLLGSHVISSKKKIANKFLMDGSKQPSKGTIKRKQWFVEQLNKHSEGHEDDIYESKPFEIIEGLFGKEESDSETSQYMLTPKREFTLVPQYGKNPVFETCPSPVDFSATIRKDADEYLYRRNKRQKIKVTEEKQNSATETFEEKESKLDIEKIMQEVNNLHKPKKRKYDPELVTEEEEEEEDSYFSDVSEDSPEFTTS